LKNDGVTCQYENSVTSRNFRGQDVRKSPEKPIQHLGPYFMQLLTKKNIYSILTFFVRKIGFV
jgi:hypothetical protein